MTDADMKAIEERCAKATPGPWVPHYERIARGQCKGKDRLITLSGSNRKSVFFPNWCEAEGCVWQIWVNIQPQDAAFISASRTDVPALVAEVRRLRVAHDKETAALESDLHHFSMRAQEAEAELSRLRAENERMAEVLEELIDLVDAAVAGEQELDSFTTQPARKALAQKGK